jgi:hypothetical protein
MRILDRLPYFPDHTIIRLRDEQIDIHRYQIVVWVSLSPARTVEWDARTPAFPAILDPGNNFTFSIFESQLNRWAGIRPELLNSLGRVKQKGKQYPRRRAEIWLHSNVPGTRERRTDREPFRLTLDKGIAVYPDEEPSSSHLPLVGLRALSESQLQTVIDGKHREVSAHTPSWIAYLLRALRLPPF